MNSTTIILFIQVGQRRACVLSGISSAAIRGSSYKPGALHSYRYQGQDLLNTRAKKVPVAGPRGTLKTNPKQISAFSLRLRLWVRTAATIVGAVRAPVHRIGAAVCTAAVHGTVAGIAAVSIATTVHGTAARCGVHSTAAVHSST